MNTRRIALIVSENGHLRTLLQSRSLCRRVNNPVPIFIAKMLIELGVRFADNIVLDCSICQAIKDSVEKIKENENGF